MPTIETKTEIPASPADVRRIFLDFASYPEWAKAHITSIEVTQGDKDDIKPGDTLKVALAGGMTFSPKVLNNTPTEFRWFGSLPYIFSGAHYYRFQDSAVTAGHTTLVQGEAFTGALAFMVGEGWKWGKQTREGFEKFNGELRARVVGAG